MKNYRIYLIRHGLTMGNIEGRYIGCKTDESLCERGINELNSIKEEFIYQQPEIVYTSPALRCIQTARIIYPDYDYIIADDLKECDFGVFENKTVEQLSDNPDYINWIKDSTANPIPEGESGRDFAYRCVKGFAEIAERMMKLKINSAAIVTHGGVIMSILSALGYPKKQMHEWVSPGGMGYEVHTSPKLWMMGNVIEIKNYVPLTKENSQEELDYSIFDAVHEDEE